MAKIRICLDAGHEGKYNQSPVIKTYFESDMNWKLHLLLKAELESYGFEVITTRPNQATDLDVYSRGTAAEGCTLFASIHSNACDSEYVDYPVVYRAYDNKGNVDALALPLAKKIAEVMGTRQAGRTATRQNNSGGEYYGVQRGARAVGLSHYLIIEHSFHTNTAATQWLLNDNSLRKLAKAEAEIIAKFYGMSSQQPTPAPTQESGFAKGDKVKVIKAVQYNGKPFTAYHDEYDVIEVGGDRIVIGIGSTITAAVNGSNLQKVGSQGQQPKAIVKGGKVKVVNAIQYNGKPFTAYYDKYDVIETDGDRVVIGIGQTVTAAVKASNLLAL